jgi:L-ascorbate metabolism protein UlaG (beta-lactamase superfamily)
MEETEGKKRWYKQGGALLEEIDRSQPGSGAAHVWFMGQHGFVVSLGGMVFYIDVILNGLPDKAGKERRVYPPPFKPEETTRADYVLCTHNHSDHLNLESLLPMAGANPKTRFVVPRPWRHILTDAGIDSGRVLGAREGEEIRLGDAGFGELSLIPVMAAHTLYNEGEPERDEHGDCPSLGYVLKGGGLALYHSGDTWLVPGLVSSLKALGPLDIAFLPINGTDWERTAGNIIGNMNALDAVKLAGTVPVDLVIPSHYDMMANNSENPALFAGYMYKLCPEKRFHISALGERFIYAKGA